MIHHSILKQGLLSTVSILLLGACASDPSACDPRKGGFIAGLSAMGSGCYEKRVEEKQEKLSSAQSLTERLQGEQKMLRHEKGSTARQKSQIQGRVLLVTTREIKPASVKARPNRLTLPGKNREMRGDSRQKYAADQAIATGGFGRSQAVGNSELKKADRGTGSRWQGMQPTSMVH
ncbi:MAG: hypothetical protein V9H25_02030 [Candidatus Competibacter sp.]